MRIFDIIRNYSGAAEDLLVPEDATRNTRWRLGVFCAWLASCGRTWQDVDLVAYRDHLLVDYAPASVRALLSAVRSRYRDLLQDNALRQALYEWSAAELARLGQRDTPADRKALVDEVLERLENSIEREIPVQEITHQDEADDDHRRLTAAEASTLLEAPGVETVRGLRDTALLATLLCSGIREAEAVALQVQDLRTRFGGTLALRVRAGKGRKSRLVPWGELRWGLEIVDAWRQVAGIESGPVFRGLYRGGSLRPTALATRTVQHIVGLYPVDGEAVTPHDLRRTYARRLYEGGVDVLIIQQNMGHVDRRTTERYIGALDADRREPPAVYSFDLERLRNIPIREG